MLEIGFTGLSIMGKSMAKNLISAGYRLVVYDISKKAAKEVMEFGTDAVGSPRQVAEKSEVIITMLSDSSVVEGVVLGENSLMQGVRQGQIYIDMSSIDPSVTQKIAKRLGEKGVQCLDAPVSGGEPSAIKGTFSIMVGGSQKTFDRC